MDTTIPTSFMGEKEAAGTQERLARRAERLDAGQCRMDPLSRPVSVLEVNQEPATAHASGNGTISQELPLADFMEPVEYGWTATAYEARQALRKYCEDTHADS